jgi:hypothetical protein
MDKNVLMKRFVKSVCLIVFGWHASIAQQGNFTLQPKGIKINSSIFSKVEVLDSRLDTSAQVGFFNGVSRTRYSQAGSLMLSQSLKDELTATATKLIDGANKQDGTLLLNVRKFFISRVFDGRGGDFGEFKFDIVCYLKRDSLYRQLFAVDSSVIVSSHSAFKIDTKLLDSTHETVGRLIQQAASFDLVHLDSTKAFTAYEIRHADDLEKKTIPVYNIDIPKKGLYTSYEDFKNNHPSNEQVLIENKKGFSRPFIFEMKEKGKKGREILHKYYYIVCDGEKMFVSNKYGLYLLTKRENDFYFTSEGRELDDVYSKAFARSLNFYATVDAKNDHALFEYKIDHQTGQFLAVKKVRD